MTTRAISKPKTYLPAVFENFFKPWNEWKPSSEWADYALSIPAVNILENADHFIVTLAAPGLKKEDFKIHIEGDQLTISSEKEESSESKEEKYSRKEYNYASFSRSFTLPESIQKDRIEAQYDNGILKLHLPKKEDVKKESLIKMIEVK